MATAPCAAWRAASRPILRPIPFSSHGLRCSKAVLRAVRPDSPSCSAPEAASQQHQQQTASSSCSGLQQGNLEAGVLTTLGMLMAAMPAHADSLALDPVNPFQTVAANSLYVTLALIIMCVPGIWSQIKRAPKANKKRKVYEVDGPARQGAMPLKDRARQIVTYFKKYNYEVKEMGEVITFAGLYKADKGQAAAVTFYTFVGMASLALVLSVLVPDVGGWWYLLTLAAPGAWFYYFQKGERVEEVKVKMATSDDDQTTDIVIEGDIEEIERFRKELDLVEKGMIKVKGLLEV